MPFGLNRTDLDDTGVSYRNGTPINLTTHTFGNVVAWAPSPAHFGNPIPTNRKEITEVTWTPDPAHFGNNINGEASSIIRLQFDMTPTQISHVGIPVNAPPVGVFPVIPAPGVGKYINVLSVTTQLQQRVAGHPSWDFPSDAQWNLGPQALFSVHANAEVTPSIIMNGFADGPTGDMAPVATWACNQQELEFCAPFSASLFDNQPFVFASAATPNQVGSTSMRFIIYYTIESLV